jgi:hypothetical protein
VRASLVGLWLAVALAAHVAAHLALLVGLARRRPKWRAVAALVVPPLAPMWGWTDGMTRRAYAWTFAVVAYAIGVIAAR